MKYGKPRIAGVGGCSKDIDELPEVISAETIEDALCL